jgi:hypothetical protein
MAQQRRTIERIPFVAQLKFSYTPKRHTRRVPGNP